MNPQTFDSFVCRTMDALGTLAKLVKSGTPTDEAHVLALHDLHEAYAAAIAGTLVPAVRVVCDPKVVKLYATHALWKALQAHAENGDTDFAQLTFAHHFAPCLKLSQR